MPDAVAAARSLLEDRLAEIESEVAQLRAALGNLGAPRPKAARPPQRKPRRGAGKRAPRGRRRAQLLAAVEKSPGATAAELGRHIGVSTNQAYGLTQRLLADGEIKRKGRGYAAV
jgi:hypothetical protein